MSSLENLKKQAKRILRWHHAGYVPVAAEIRASLPRFHTCDDRTILNHVFKLADAQELVARQNGFSSWQALLEGLPTMTTAQPTNTPPTIITAEAQLLVRDIDAACAYYRDKLGFAVAFTYGEPAYYAQVKRNAAHLNLRCMAPLPGERERREAEQLLAATLTLATADELKQLYLEMQSAGADIAQAMTTQPWGARNFIVRDLDGNLILFASPDAS